MQPKKYADKLVGWKYYNTITKKAMEKEFSWSGLIISLSIAFFIVLISAQILNVIYRSTTNKLKTIKSSSQQIEYNWYHDSNKTDNNPLKTLSTKVALIIEKDNYQNIHTNFIDNHLLKEVELIRPG